MVLEEVEDLLAEFFLSVAFLVVLVSFEEEPFLATSDVDLFLVFLGLLSFFTALTEALFLVLLLDLGASPTAFTFSIISFSTLSFATLGISSSE